MPKIPDYAFNQRVNFTGNVGRANPTFLHNAAGSGSFFNAPPALRAPEMAPDTRPAPIDKVGGQALNGLAVFADHMAKAAFEVQERSDDLEVRQKLMELDSAMRDLWERPDPENNQVAGYGATTGKDAVNRHQQYRQDVDQIFNSVVGGMTSRQQEKLLAGGGMPLRAKYHNAGADHYVRQLDVAEKQTTAVEAQSLISKVSSGEDVFAPGTDGVSEFDRVMTRAKTEQARVSLQKVVINDIAAQTALQGGSFAAVKYLEDLANQRPDLVRRDPSAFRETAQTYISNARRDLAYGKEQGKAATEEVYTRARGEMPNILNSLLFSEPESVNRAMSNFTGMGTAAGEKGSEAHLTASTESAFRSFVRGRELAGSTDPVGDLDRHLAKAESALTPANLNIARVARESLRGEMVRQRTDARNELSAIETDREKAVKRNEESALDELYRFLNRTDIPTTAKQEAVSGMATSSFGHLVTKHKSNIEAALAGVQLPESEYRRAYNEKREQYLLDPEKLRQDFGHTPVYDKLRGEIDKDRKSGMDALKTSAHDQFTAWFTSKEKSAFGGFASDQDSQQAAALARAKDVYDSSAGAAVKAGKTPQEAHSLAMQKVTQDPSLTRYAVFKPDKEGDPPKFEKVYGVFSRGGVGLASTMPGKAVNEDLFEAVHSNFSGEFSSYLADAGGDPQVALRAISVDFADSFKSKLNSLRAAGRFADYEAVYREFGVFQQQERFLRQYPDSVNMFLKLNGKSTEKPATKSKGGAVKDVLEAR